MQNQSTTICPCGCGLPVSPGKRFRRGHHWKALATERFWSQVDRSGGPEACWPWTGARSSSGYGQFGINGGQVGSHCQSYTLTYGPIPDGLWVLHRCDNPPCCNPAHLFLGTPKDNTQDALSKGRITSGDAHWTRRHPERLPRGERHPQSKLSDSQRGEVITLWDTGEYSVQDLASRFGVHRDTIRNLCIPKSERGPRCKLTKEQVQEIREGGAAGERGATLAKRYHVSPSTISMILSGQRWGPDE